MGNVVEEIRAEHAGMARLLKVLDQQTAIFEAADRPDYDLIQSIVDYFLGFPDQCHHPKEDLLAQRMLMLDPERAGQLRGLAALHEELALLTRKVADVVGNIVDDVAVPRADFVRAVREFVDSQRHHIEMEEAYFLPLAEELLSDADFEALDSEIFRKQEPLFGATTEQHFTDLRNDIVNWEKANP